MTTNLHQGTAPGFIGLLVQSLHHNYFGVLHRSGEARKSAVFAAPDGLHHNYFADHYGEAGKPGFTTAPPTEWLPSGEGRHRRCGEPTWKVS